MADKTSFYDYVRTQKQKHRESERPHERHNVLYFDSAYSEIRHKNMMDKKHHNHIEFHRKHHERKHEAHLGESTDFLEVLLENADDELHDHPEVKSEHPVENHEKHSLKHFTGKSYDDKETGYASSRNMNTYLRSKHSKDYEWLGDHSEEKTKKAIDTLHKTIKKHSNRKEVTVYTGVPQKVADAFEKHGKESHHLLPGFTSTSSSRRVARQFAAKSQEHVDHPLHIIKAVSKPGTGMSIRDHSSFPGEHEFALNKGSKLTYHRTTKHTDEDGQETHIHHVTVHGSD